MQRFLNPILPDVSNTHVPRGLEGVGSMGLGHGNDRDLALLSVPAAPCRCVDPLPNLPNPVRQVEKRHKAATYR
jgi:hypothetical protein